MSELEEQITKINTLIKNHTNDRQKRIKGYIQQLKKLKDYSALTSCLGL